MQAAQLGLQAGQQCTHSKVLQCPAQALCIPLGHLHMHLVNSSHGHYLDAYAVFMALASSICASCRHLLTQDRLQQLQLEIWHE